MTNPITFQSKLKSYLAFASCVAAANSANSQIIYTDVIPDDTLFVNDAYALDLNNSGGSPDFGVFISSSSGSQSAVLAPDLSGNNWVAGHPGIGSEYFASAFNAGQTIGPTQNWYYSQSYMFMVFQGGLSFFGDWIDVTDKFGGLKIMDGANQYYGWVRMDVQTQPFGVIVKDYAYNSIANTPLAAGEEDPQAIAPLNQSSNISIFAFGKEVYINATNTGGKEMAITVTDILGKTVLTTTTKENFVHLNLNGLPGGMYLVNVSNRSEVKTTKVSIQ